MNTFQRLWCTDCNHRFCSRCTLTLIHLEGSRRTFRCPMCRQTTRVAGHDKDVFHIKVYHEEQVIDFCFFQSRQLDLTPRWHMQSDWTQMTPGHITIAFLDEEAVTRTRQDLAELRGMFQGDIDDIDNPYGKLLLHAPLMNLWKDFLLGVVQAKHKPLLGKITEIYSYWNKRPISSTNFAALLICTSRFYIRPEGATSYTLST